MTEGISEGMARKYVIDKALPVVNKAIGELAALLFIPLIPAHLSCLSSLPFTAALKVKIIKCEDFYLNLKVATFPASVSDCQLFFSGLGTRLSRIGLCNVSAYRHAIPDHGRHGWVAWPELAHDVLCGLHMGNRLPEPCYWQQRSATTSPS